MPRRKGLASATDGSVTPGLTNKEKMFCAEYLACFDAKNAAIKAGYAPKYAKAQGAQVLHRPEVSAYIKKLQDERLFKLAITADMVVQELAKIAFSNIDDFIAGNGENTDEKGNVIYPAAVSQRIIKVDIKTGARTITHFSLHSKIEALCALGRNLGVFAKEAQKGKGSAPVIYTPRNKMGDEVI